MNKKYSLSFLVAILASSSMLAQDLTEAKKAIKDEQYDKAKSILLDLVAKKPKEGANFFYLGDVFLKEDLVDSARYYFDQGLLLKDKGTLNLVGLGQIDLDNNRSKDAKAKFTKAVDAMKKKDYNEHLLIAEAYLNSKNPDAVAAQKIAEVVATDDYKNAKAHMVLGRAYSAQNNLGKAYSSFRNAYDLDNTYLDAKLELAYINMRSRAYNEAIAGCEEIISLDDQYAPAYRLLADIYYYSAKADAKNEQELLNKAGKFYKQYMEVSGGSLEARMKYADFLVLTDNFTELEVVSKPMMDIKGVNPRIFRYYGYATYESKKYEESVKALEKYLILVGQSTTLKAIGKDYMYLGLDYIALANNGNKAMYEKGLKNLRDAVLVEPVIANSFNRIGLSLFKEDKYHEVIDLLSISAAIKDNENYIYDNYYVGYSYYFLGKEDVNAGQELLKKCSEYLTNVINVAPSTAEAYFFKARASRYINTVEAQKDMLDAYQGYIKVLQDKGELDSAANKDKVVESYTSIATYYANNNDNAKALDTFEIVLKRDPSNAFAKRTVDAIKKGK